MPKFVSDIWIWLIEKKFVFDKLMDWLIVNSGAETSLFGLFSTLYVCVFLLYSTADFT